MNHNSLLKSIDILKILVYKEWVVKYKSTFLGYIWSIAHPLMLALVFYIAFKIVVKVPIENYTLFLVSGLFAWQWFMNSVSIGVWSFVANAPLIKKTIFPRYLLVMASVIVDMIHFVVSIPIIMLVLYLYSYDFFHIEWLYQLPLLIVIQILLSFSFALIFGTLNVFVRDVDRIISLLLMLMMYLTPIFYSLDMVPKSLKVWFYLNPMVAIVELWREVFYNGSLDFTLLAISFGHLIFWLFLGYVIYQKLSYKFAENL